MADRPPFMTSTLWSFPSQRYSRHGHGDAHYGGVTPAYVVWNVVKRYARKGDLVIDPMVGSGTTLDVCRDLGRRALGFDLQPHHPDAREADARHLPVGDGVADLVFVDPPYSTHLRYSGRPECVGEIEGGTPAWDRAMDELGDEFLRVLKPGGVLAAYLSDSYRFDAVPAFVPLAFDLFSRWRGRFEPVDIVTVARHHRSLADPVLLEKARRAHAMLRGFAYLLVLRKPRGAKIMPPPPTPARETRGERPAGAPRRGRGGPSRG